MLNVDAGNSPTRPDNPRELRSAWRVTWLAVIGFMLFVLLFMAVDWLGGRDSPAQPPLQQEQADPTKGGRAPSEGQQAPGQQSPPS
jgi:hypothetical protein